MSYQIYVGIDVSKLSLDVYVREKQAHKCFNNEVKGFTALLHWLEVITKLPCGVMFFCFEHTGLYSMQLALFLDEHHLTFSMVPSLQVKRSLGIARGKNDIVDSKRIADYACHFQDVISPTTLPVRDIYKLQSLLSLRDKLARQHGAYVGSRNELQRVINHADVPELFASYDTMISTMHMEIKRIESAMKNIIIKNSELRTSVELITSIKGIGLIIATHLIVYTCNFTRFDKWRKFACYAGVAPFEYRSGTSIHGKTQVSSIANKQMKKMLHLAAISAIHFDSELREYYRRKTAEGKSNMTVINIVRNKLLARIFAVIKRRTIFVDTKKYMS
jgi:transposase